MSGVDYSKWDRLAKELSDSDSDSDSDGSEGGVMGNKPLVTRFDEPQSVTFGGNPTPKGDVIGEGGSESQDKQEVVGKASTLAVQECMDVSTSKTSVKGFADLTRNGGDVGARGGRTRYLWSQTRYEVMVVLTVPLGTRAGDVDICLEPKPDTVAEGIADLLRVGLKEGINLLEGELSFPVKLEEEIDWEVKDYPVTSFVAPLTETSTPARMDSQRGIVLTLRKHVPMAGVTLWWKSVLKGDPEIDVSRIHGRDMKHQSVWEEAMGMFKENMAKRRSQGKIEVDVS
ncbi:unnamed protein product [Choristocarpus tenellus]